MKSITYPTQTNPERSLTGIFTIETTQNIDHVYLGKDQKVLLGFIDSKDNNLFAFVPEKQIEQPFPNRTSYSACLLDAFTCIANDLDLAIEFTILVNRKRDSFYGLESK